MLHVVLFKFDPAKFAAEFPGNNLQESVAALKAKVPGVLDITMNEKNVAPWEGYVDCAQGYTHCLVSKHADAAALKVYAEHPDHKAVQARFGKCVTAPALRMELNVPAKL